MVTYEQTRSTSTFGAIADPTRRAILDLLRAGELTAGELADNFPMSRPAVSKHVRVLRHAGLIRERREAQSRFYTLDPQRLGEVDAWLAPYRVFWAARLQDLRQFVEADHARRHARSRGARKKNRSRP